MKDGTTYPRNTALAILVSGEPGSGKSNFIFDWPNPYIIDGDKNLKNAIERHPGKQFYYADPELDDNGKPLPPHEHWLRMEKLIKEHAAKPEVGVLAVDSLSRVSDYLKAFLVFKGSEAEKVITAGGEKVMNRTLWEPFAQLMKRFVFLCRSFNKPFILTTHLRVEENELTTVKEQKVNLQGQLVGDFPKMFTDWWLCAAIPSTDAKYKEANGVRYYIRTTPTNRASFKQSCRLPAEFEPGDEHFRKLLENLKTPTA